MRCDIVLVSVRTAWFVGGLVFAASAAGEHRSEGGKPPEDPQERRYVTRRYEIRADPREGRLVRVGRAGTKSERIEEAVAGAAGSGRVDVDALIRRLGESHGLPPELLRAVIRQESAFDPYAVSRKGAQGLMQLMPATARRLGVKDVFDPAENVLGGVRLLRQLLDRYGGDARLALAAYNAGEGAVDRYGAVPPYPETRDYVDRIVGRSDTEDAAMSGEPTETIGRTGSRAVRFVDSDGSVRYEVQRD